MMKMLGNLVVFIWSKFRITANLAAENLALRQQLAIMKRTNKRVTIHLYAIGIDNRASIKTPG